MSGYPATLTLAPVQRLTGTVRVPGSKSLSNRALLLAALAAGETTLTGLLDSDDVRHMLAALRALGVNWTAGDDCTVTVEGTGGRLPHVQGELFLGNAGTAVRTLVAALALQGADPGQSVAIRGIERMHERPIGDLVDAVRALGADVRYLGAEGYPPLAIGPRGDTEAARVTVRGSVSSQFTTGLLQAAPLLPNGLTIDIDGELISKPYVDMTVALMRRFGVTVAPTANGFQVAAGQRYAAPGRCAVEGDASSASYFLAAGLLGQGPVTVQGVGNASLQGDVAFARHLAEFGADVRIDADEIHVQRNGSIPAFDGDFNDIPDAAMTFAVVAMFADGPCTLRNIASWRVKETDRIHAMATELAKFGTRVEQGEDWLRVWPCPSPAPGVAVDTYDDHRIAMCFSLVACAGVSVTINDPGCVAKTFPGYFTAFDRLREAAA
ncbi:MAG: 3-phosphoshikimate 1-carboxyvinyltransferase [Pseudomonadota bacterium]